MLAFSPALMGARLSALAHSLATHPALRRVPASPVDVAAKAATAPSTRPHTRSRSPSPTRAPGDRRVQTSVHVAEACLLDHLTRAPYTKRLVPLPNGHHLNTLSAGREGCPTLVVLHGWGAGAAFFGRNLDGLAKHFRVHLVDWPGFAASSRPDFDTAADDPVEAERFFVDALAAWVVSMRAAEPHFPTRFHVLGHSLGAYLATVFALRHPAHVASLVLASPAGVPPRASVPLPAAMLPRLKVRIALALWGLGVTPQMALRAAGPWLGRLLARAMLLPRFARAPRRVVDALATYFHAAAAAPPSAERSLTAILTPGAFARLPLCHRVHALDAPTTFLYGDRDWMPVQAARDVAARMAAPAAVAVVQDAGHHLYFDAPDEFNRHVVDACAKAELRAEGER